MDKEKQIREIIHQYCGGTYTNRDKATKEILSLFSVVWQGEQLCDGLHSTDFNGKCFKCGEQVFIREPK